jgi:hypothetical protein
MLSLWTNYWEDWELFHKVTFDGINRLIIINSDVNQIDVLRDIYSSWKEWSQVRDNTKFLPALRVTGGDPIGGGEFTGSVFFMINNWRIFVDHSVNIDGVIYSDNFPSPFVQPDDVSIVTNKVSSLVQTVAPVITGDIVVDGNIPTVVEIRQEMDANSTQFAAILAQTANTEPQLAQISANITTIENQVTQISNSQLSSADIAGAVRTELSPELAYLLTLENTSLTANQATMLLEMYELLGLDPSKPLVVTKTARVAGSIAQTITSNDTQTVVSRD